MIVKNNGYYDVDVYSVRTEGGAPIREGTVSGAGTRRLTIPMNDLESGHYLVVELRAIGTQYTWLSRSISLSRGDAAQLTIIMDAYGGMARSTLVPVNNQAPPTTNDDQRHRPTP